MLRFKQAQSVKKGQAITSTQYNALAQAFNDRLKAGAGDPSWRIFWYAHSLVRNLRNPQRGAVEGADNWPADDEWWKLYSHIENNNTCGETTGSAYHWPLAEPGEESGINVGSPLGAFIYGVEKAEKSIWSEPERLTYSVGDGNPYFGKAAPLILAAGTNEQSAIKASWDIAKNQRGYIDYLPYMAGTSPAIETAHAHAHWLINSISPSLKSPTCFKPTAAASGNCGEWNGVIVPKWEIVFTPLVSGKSVLKFGTCPGVDGDVQYVDYGANAYTVFIQGRPTLTLTYVEYIEGPYTGGGRLGKEKGVQLIEMVNKFVAEFRGDLQSRQEYPNSYSIKEGLFNFQSFMTSQYSLAPAFTSYDTNEIRASDVYPNFGIRYTIEKPTFESGELLVCNNNTDSYKFQGVFGGFLITAKGIKTNSVILEILNDNEPIGNISRYLTIDTGDTEKYYVYYFPETVFPSTVKVRLGTKCEFRADGAINIEFLDQVPYIPDINDAYLVLRLASTTGDEESPDKTGLDSIDPTAKAIWSNYSKYRCLINTHGVTTSADYPMAINWNPMYDSARKLIHDNLRMVPREQLCKYEVVDGKSSLYFFRSYLHYSTDSAAEAQEKLYPIVPKLSEQRLITTNATTLKEGIEYLVVADVSPLPVQTTYIARTTGEHNKYTVRWPIYNDLKYGVVERCSAFLIYAGVKYAPPGYNDVTSESVSNLITGISSAEVDKSNLIATSDQTITVTSADAQGITIITPIQAKRISWAEIDNVTLLPSNDQAVDFESYANGWRYKLTRPLFTSEDLKTVTLDTAGRVVFDKIKYDSTNAVYYVDDVNAFGKTATYTLLATPTIDIQAPNTFKLSVTPKYKYFPIRITWAAGGSGKYQIIRHTFINHEAKTKIIASNITGTEYIDYLSDLQFTVDGTTPSETVTHYTIKYGGTEHLATIDTNGIDYVVESSQTVPIQDANLFSYTENSESEPQPGYKFYGTTDTDDVMAFRYTATTISNEITTVTETDGAVGTILTWYKSLTTNQKNSKLRFLYNNSETVAGQPTTPIPVNNWGVFILSDKSGTDITNKANGDAAADIKITALISGAWTTDKPAIISRFNSYTDSQLTASANDIYVLNTGYEVLTKAVYRLPVVGATYKVRGNGYVTYKPASWVDGNKFKYFEGETFVESGNLNYIPSDYSVSVARVVRSTCGSETFDSFANIAPAFNLGEPQLIDGQTYKVYGTGSVAYYSEVGGVITSNSKAPNDIFVWTVESPRCYGLEVPNTARVRPVEGIRSSAPKKSISNQWNMFISLNLYHTSESSMWKTDIYGDTMTFLHNRCHTYAPELTKANNGDINRELCFGAPIALRSEAPSGYNYIKDVNSPVGAVTADDNAFVRSCKIYKPDYEIESVTVAPVTTGDMSEVIKVTLKGRLDHYNDGLTSIAYTDVTNASFREQIKAQPYRTDENAVLEYLMRPTAQCSFKMGDQALNAEINLMPDNPFGCCLPRFYFIRQVPYVYEDTNDVIDSPDTLLTVDPFLQMELYLRPMCTGFIDMKALEAIQCDTGMAISPIADYTFENLCYQNCRPKGSEINPTIVTTNSIKRQPEGIVSEYSFEYTGGLVLSDYTIYCEYRSFDLVKCEWSVPSLYSENFDLTTKLTVPFNGNQAVKYEFLFYYYVGETQTLLDHVTTTCYNTIKFEFLEGHSYTLYQNNTTSINCIEAGEVEILNAIQVTADAQNTSYSDGDSTLIDYRINNPVFIGATEITISYSLLDSSETSVDGVYGVTWTPQPRVVYDIQRKIINNEYGSEGDWATIKKNTLPVYYDVPPQIPALTKDVTVDITPIWTEDHTPVVINLTGSDITTLNGGGTLTLDFGAITTLLPASRLFYLFRTVRFTYGGRETTLSQEEPELLTASPTINPSAHTKVVDKTLWPSYYVPLTSETVTVTYTVKYKSGLNLTFNKLPNHTVLTAAISNPTKPTHLKYRLYQTLQQTIPATPDTIRTPITTTAIGDITVPSDASPCTVQYTSFISNFDLLDIPDTNNIVNNIESYKVIAEWNDYGIKEIDYLVIATTGDRVRAFTSMPVSLNIRKPLGCSTLPNTSIYAEVFNNYVNCINALTYCRVEVPLTVKYREKYINSTLTGSVYANLSRWIEGSANIGTTATTFSDWAEGTPTVFAQIDVGPNKDGNYRTDGTNYYPFITYAEVQHEFYIPKDQLFLNAIPDILKGNFDFNNLMFYGNKSIGQTKNSYTLTTDYNAENVLKCAGGFAPDYTSNPSKYIVGVSTINITSRCVAFTGGVISAPSAPSTYNLKVWHDASRNCGLPVGGIQNSVSVDNLNPVKYMSFPLY